MYHCVPFILGCLAAPTFAAPVENRAAPGPPGGDITILNYALALEYLERKFYQEGIQNFTAQDFANAGFGADFYTNLQTVYSDEQTHVSFLTTALGSQAIGEPTFAFPVTDAKSFVGLASVLEGVGVSAYLGAAPEIASTEYLTAAGSILVVEARHSSYIRAALSERPFPNPFDTPLDFNQVFSLASQFITGLAPGTSLPFKAFPPLTVVNPGSSATYATGQDVEFMGAFQNAEQAGLDQGTPVFAVFFSGLQTYYMPATISGANYMTTIPGASGGQPAPSGQVYVILSTADGTGNNTASDENTISGVGITEIGD